MAAERLFKIFFVISKADIFKSSPQSWLCAAFNLQLVVGEGLCYISYGYFIAWYLPWMIVTRDMLFPNAGKNLSPLTLHPGDGLTQGCSGGRRSHRPVHSTVHHRDLSQLLCDSPFRPVQPQHNEWCGSWDTHPSHLPRFVSVRTALPMAPHTAVSRCAAVPWGSGGKLPWPVFPVCPKSLTLICVLLFFALFLSAHLVLFTCRHTDPQAEAVVQRDLHLSFCHQQLSRGIRGWHSPGLWVRTAPGAAFGTFVLCSGAGRQVFFARFQGYFLQGIAFMSVFPRNYIVACSHTMYF